MFELVIEDQPYCTGSDLRRKLVRRLAHDGSTFSGVGASDQPGAVQDEGENEGLEEAAVPFFHRITKFLGTFGPPVGDHSWFVNYDFGRPAMLWATLRPMLKEAFSNFAQNPIGKPSEYKFGKSLKIQIKRSNLKFENFFVLGAHTDDQAGGWIISEMIRNLDLCIAEKTRKIENYKARYPEWWFILVDLVSFGGWDADDVAEIRQHMSKRPDWDKVVVIDPSNCARSFEL
jgi:hypothetical protein